MRGFINFIRSDKIIWQGTLISLTLLIGNLFFLLFFYRLLPPYIPLYNQLPWGTERLGTTIELFIPLGLTLTIFFVNLFLVKIWYDTLPLLSRIVSVTTLLITIFALIFTLRIIQMVI